MTSAALGIADATLLRRPSLARPEELFRLYGEGPELRRFGVISHANYADLRDGLAGSATLVAHQHTTAALGPREGAETLSVELVSGNYFGALAVVPQIGRALRPEDDVLPSGHSVVVVSDRLWHARLGAVSDVTGRTLLLNGQPFAIVGVAPRGFAGSFEAMAADAWVPVTTQDRVRPRGLGLDQRGWGWLFATGRRLPGIPQAAVDANLRRLVAEMTRDGRLAEGEGFHMTSASPVPDGIRGDGVRAMGLVLGIVVALLVGVCANVAGLTLARAAAREHEIATRQAIGASPRRLLRQLLAESLLLSALGAVAGLVLARWTVEFLIMFMPSALQGLSPDMLFDGRLLGIAAVAATLVALASGLAPALRAIRAAPATSLRARPSAPRSGGQAVAVALQATVSAALIVVSGLLLHSLRRSQAFDPGFDVERIALASFDLQRLGYDEDRGRAFQAALVERLRLLPEIEAVAMATMVPLGDTEDVQGFRVTGHAPAPDKEGFRANVNVVGVDYFRALGIRLREGRGFAPEDARPGASTVVVSEAFARRFWPRGGAVGRTIQMLDGRELTIVGIAADVPYGQLGEPPRSIVYACLGAAYRPWVTLQVRTRSAPAALLPTIRRVFAELDGRVVPQSVHTFVEQRAAMLFPARALGLVAGSFGLVALGLAASGLFGLVSYTVRRRTREIGIRIALGAAAAALARLVLGQALRPALAGALLGSLLGVGAGRALAHLLFGVGPLDPISHGVAFALVAATSLLAALGPTLHALRVDPALVLRSE